MKKIIACFLIISLTSACGWHLRGSISLPDSLTSLYVSAADAHGALITEIKQRLRANKVALAETAADAPYSLVIVEERNERRTAGVGSDALTSAYEVTLAADYEVRARSGERLAPVTTAITSRTYNFSPGNASSAEQEEAILLSEMRREIAQQMLRRLQSAVAAHNPLPSESDNQTTESNSPATETTPAEAPDGQAAP